MTTRQAPPGFLWRCVGDGRDPDPCRAASGSDVHGALPEGMEESECRCWTEKDVELMEERKQYPPRLWIGDSCHTPYWLWTGRWQRIRKSPIEPGDIFVPGNQPEPEEDPREMKSLETCREIDWGNE